MTRRACLAVAADAEPRLAARGVVDNLVVTAPAEHRVVATVPFLDGEAFI
ncbi:hypothetical protein N9D23_08450 [Rubripirellula sp.]|jgi:hypothetical protein|nr:hypothetical protein [Rubripirellula sp.]